MDTNELLKRVREIEIRSRGKTKQIFSGDYNSAFKGRGMTFSEVRNYHFQDDVRTIDWNVTARFNEPFVKVFEEERELSVFLVIDVSGSNAFGTGERSKKELITEIAAVLLFSVTSNNDKVGVILISDHVEKYIPPKKGRKHALRIVRELLEFKPESTGTNLNEGLKFFRNIVKKRSICFVISDFFDNHNFIEGLKIANSHHDMIALRIYDPLEKHLPNLGLIKMYDAEKGSVGWINTSSKRVRRKYKEKFIQQEEQLNESLRRSGIDYAILPTDKAYITELYKLFQRRR